MTGVPGPCRPADTPDRGVRRLPGDGVEREGLGGLVDFLKQRKDDGIVERKRQAENRAEPDVARQVDTVLGLPVVGACRVAQPVAGEVETKLEAVLFPVGRAVGVVERER